MTRMADERMNINRRSYDAITNKPTWLKKRKTRDKASGVLKDAESSQQPFTFTASSVRDETLSIEESSFAQTLRDAQWSNNVSMFCSLYDFARHVCAGISRKSHASLEKLYGSINRSAN